MTQPEELHCLFEGNVEGEPLVDIVAVHGLNPTRREDHAWSTWTVTTAEGADHLWLRDDLPKVAPRARIFLYQYNSFPALSESKTRFLWDADKLLSCLEVERYDAPNRPLVFVAHSLGGILVKQALVNAFANPRYRPIHNATRALVFFGVPHGGGNNTAVYLGSIAVQIFNAVTFSASNDLMQAVKSGSLYSDTLQSGFRHQLLQFDSIVSFVEKKGKVTIVDRESATIGLPGDLEHIVELQRTHSDLCRFNLHDSGDMASYKQVRHNMRVIYDKVTQRSTEMERLATLSPPVSTAGLTAPTSLGPVEITNFIRTAAFSYPAHSHFLIQNEQYSILSYVKAFGHYDYEGEELVRLRAAKYPSTCRWLAKTEAIKWWSSRDANTILWLYGVPGLGKSTLLSHLVDNPSSMTGARLGNRKKGIVAYSFCNHERNYTASMVLCVLIHQILEQFPEIQKTVCEYDYKRYLPIDGGWPKRPAAHMNRKPQILWKILEKAVIESKMPKVFLIIDALDECDQRAQKDLVDLSQGSMSSSCHLKILFSSRPDESLKSRFSDLASRQPAHFRYQSLEDYDDFILQDLSLYIDGEIDRLSRDRFITSADRDLIHKKLTAERSAVFLPVALLFSEIASGSGRAISEILEDLPRDLQKLYTRLIEKLPETKFDLRLLLGLLLYAFGPITLQDVAFYIMLAVTPHLVAAPDAVVDESILLSVHNDLKHLDTIIRISNKEVVSFVHISAKQFLVERSLDQASPPSAPFPTPWDTHGMIAMMCLRVIIMKAGALNDQDWYAPISQRRKLANVSRYPLLLYALRYWTRHLKRAFDLQSPSERTNRELILLVERFTHLWNTTSPQFRWTIAQYSGIEGIKSRYSGIEGIKTQQLTQLTLMELFSGMGLDILLKDHLARFPSDYHHAGKVISHSLRLAIQGGHESTFDVLIEHFKITSLDKGIYNGITSDLAWSRNSQLLRKVMKMRRRVRLYELVHAVTIAFSTGDRSTLDELTRSRDIFRMRDQWGRTALHISILQIYSTLPQDSGASLMQILATTLFYISHGVDVNARDVFGYTALHYVCWWATSCENIIIKGLIRHGADPYITTKGGLTPLHFAVRAAKDIKPIQTLLQATSYIQLGAKSNGGNTVLHWALSRHKRTFAANADQDESMMYGLLELLVRNGADPHVQNRKGCTPIGWVWAPEYGEIFMSLYNKFDRIYAHDPGLLAKDSAFTAPKLDKNYRRWLQANCLDQFRGLVEPPPRAKSHGLFSRRRKNRNLAPDDATQAATEVSVDEEWPRRVFEDSRKQRIVELNDEDEDEEEDRESIEDDESLTFFTAADEPPEDMERMAQWREEAHFVPGRSNTQNQNEGLGHKNRWWKSRSPGRREQGEPGNGFLQSRRGFRQRLYEFFTSSRTRSRRPSPSRL